MSETKKSLFSWLTYRPKWALRKKVNAALREANTLFASALKEIDGMQPTVDNLIALGHKATANAYCDMRTAFIGTHNSIITEISGDYKHAAKDCLRATIAQLERYIDTLKDSKPLANWDASPRHELALRAEIGIKVRRIYNLADDINHMMPSKLGPIVAARDFDLLEDFVEIMRLCAALTHEPRIKHFAELNAFMSRLLALDTRMHELKRILREHH